MLYSRTYLDLKRLQMETGKIGQRGRGIFGVEGQYKGQHML